MKITPVLLFALTTLTSTGSETFRTSPIADRMIMDSVIESAKSGLKIQLTDVGESAGAKQFRGSFEKFFTVDSDDETRSRFITAFRSATQRLLGDRGATIHNWGKRGSGGDLRGFSWEYGWNENHGVLIVRFVPTTSGKGELTVFCYEHIRGAPMPPRHKDY
ncbi:MAG: hypothetical protein JNL39_13475 [Opitutaceae bacterium]|nr:hypothetical protein [Opitutaceae bacterium]